MSTEIVFDGKPLPDVTSIEVDCGDGITRTYAGSEDLWFVEFQNEVVLTGKYEPWPNIKLEIAKIVGWRDQEFIKHDGWK